MEDFPDDIELLMDLCSVDEVEARIPTAMEQDTGIYPPWSELILSVQRNPNPGGDSWPLNIRIPLRRHDGELIRLLLDDVLDRGGTDNSIECLWADLDSAVARIQRRVERGKEPLKRDVGFALGIATALAYLETGTTEPDVDAIRERAMERYED